TKMNLLSPDSIQWQARTDKVAWVVEQRRNRFCLTGESGVVDLIHKGRRSATGSTRPRGQARWTTVLITSALAWVISPPQLAFTAMPSDAASCVMPLR